MAPNPVASSSVVTNSRDLISTLRRGSVEAFSINFIGLGLMFLMHSVLGRLIGPEQYGIFSYALSIATLLSVVVPLGWHTATMRFVAQYTAQRKPGLVLGSILRGHQVTLISYCLVFCLPWALRRFDYLPPRLARSFLFANLLLLPLTFFVLHHRIFRGLQKIRASMIPKSIILPLLVIVSAFSFAAGTAHDVITLYFAAGVLSCFMSALWLWHTLQRNGLIVPPEYQTRIWLGIALPMAFGGFSRVIIDRADILMLGVMDNMDVVGVYSAATRIATMNTFALAAIITIASPLLSSAYHSEKLQEFRLILRRSMVWSAIAGFPLLMIMLLWPEAILKCFGEDFAGGSPLLRILAVGQYINSATGPVGMALLMSDQEGPFALSGGVVAVMNILANFLLILKMGALGAALATSLCLAILNLWRLYLCSKKI